MSRRRSLLVAVVLIGLAACSREVPSDVPPPSPEPPPTIVASPVPPAPTPSSSETFVPLPTAPTLSAEPGGELLIECDAPPFSTSLLDRPADGELAPHPAAAFFRSMNVERTSVYGPVAEGWWAVADQATQIQFLGRRDDEWFIYHRVHFGPEGWASTNAGECTLRPGSMRGLSRATWELDPAEAPLQPWSTSVDVLVTEIECTGGARVDDRLLRPAVIYGPESVMIIVAAVVLEGAGDCLANPRAPLTVRLREPLGDRTVRGWVPPPNSGG
jgi:hypothetical protein